MRVIALLIVLVLFSCKDDCDPNVICPTAETLDATPWIAHLKSTLTNCSCEVSIVKSTYKGETVFFTAVTDPLCNSINIPTLYNCSGGVVKTFTDSEADQQEVQRLSYDEVLYRCKD